MYIGNFDLDFALAGPHFGNGVIKSGTLVHFFFFFSGVPPFQDPLN